MVRSTSLQFPNGPLLKPIKSRDEEVVTSIKRDVNTEYPLDESDKYKLYLCYKLIVLTRNKKTILSKAMHNKINYILTEQLEGWNLALIDYKEAPHFMEISFSIDANINLHNFIIEFKKYTSQLLLAQFSTAISMFSLKQSIWEDGYLLQTIQSNAEAEQKKYTAENQTVYPTF